MMGIERRLGSLLAWGVMVVGLLAAVAPLTTLPLGAQGRAPELKTLFTKQAPIRVVSERLSRLELPAEVLAECRPDLSDLRVFDAAGNEAPFLVDSGLAPGREATISRSYELEISAVTRGETRRETGPPIYRETYELAIPPEMAADIEAGSEARGLWDLVLRIRRGSYVRRVRVTARQTDGREVSLVEDGSIFRLTNPLREKTRITLPRLGGDGLIVTLEGEDDAYLNPVFRLETARSFQAREQAVVRLEELARRESDRRTVIELRRPAGLVPGSLRLGAADVSFSRVVTVWDEGRGGAEGSLGTKRLFRVRAAATVEDVSIPLRPARGESLRVVIENLDSPALKELTFHAVVQRPALVFSLPPGRADQPAGMLRFGGSRAFRPRYDVAHFEGARRGPSYGRGAEVAEQLWDLPPATLGEVETNPDFDSTPILAFAMRPGTEIDSRLYTHRRKLTALSAASPDGLYRLRLDLEDLANAKEDLADLRIVDGQSRQWAYLLERNARRVDRALTVEREQTGEGASAYELRLPASPLVLDQISLETGVPYFDRGYELIATVGESERTVAQGRMSRRVGDPRPVRIGFPAVRADALRLVIDNGDDAPLDFERISGRFPVPEAYFAATPGEYSLLLGNPEDTAPRYELANVKDVVLAVRSADVRAAPLEPNPRYSATARMVTESGAQQTALWVILVIAVVFLGGLTLKLARADEEEPPDAA